MSAKDLFFRLFSVKYAALALLVLQNTFLVVYMHYSRTMQGPMYAASTAVACMELLKFVTCITVVAYQGGGVNAAYRSMKDEVLTQPYEILKLSVPSLLYTVQNNLLFYALSHLDAATFQVGYQVKILTTAVFSVLMLGRRLSANQWLSLLVLTLGVSLAQSSASSASDAHNTTSGFAAVLLAACTSGFSGVYFERILKNSGTSVWVRNIQMGLSSITLGFLGIFLSGEGPQVYEHGFFYGYNRVVWGVIVLQAVGGIVVAVVVKYADNILKGFAASFSIVTSCLLSYALFDFRPTPTFLLGALLVFAATYLYSQQPALRREKGGEEEQALVDSSANPINTRSDLQAMERGGGGGSGGGGNGGEEEEGPNSPSRDSRDK
ncbi:nucleotide-sugar transporter-domain-containing protein [Ochromonadaceae sp. CCMP2298]|nr:nucleotide-sugar transporter-domain-containing protein [Ochromonadaceae sp. CCMP2298]